MKNLICMIAHDWRLVWEDQVWYCEEEVLKDRYMFVCRRCRKLKGEMWGPGGEELKEK